MLYIGVGQTYFSLITLLCYLLNFVPYIYIYIFPIQKEKCIFTCITSTIL